MTADNLWSTRANHEGMGSRTAPLARLSDDFLKGRCEVLRSGGVLTNLSTPSEL